MGLVGKPAGGGCSAVLIEPDLVLTAGHCVNVPGDEGATLVFRPSTAEGAPGPAYQGRRVTLHPTWIEHLTGTSGIDDIISRDIALFRLGAPVPPEVARPIPVGPLPEDTSALRLISFRAGKPPLRLRDCPLDDLRDQVFVVACAVRSGESGAPVAALLPGGPVIVGIVSRRSREGAVETALGALLGDNYALLRQAEAPLNPPGGVPN